MTEGPRPTPARKDTDPRHRTKAGVRAAVAVTAAIGLGGLTACGDGYRTTVIDCRDSSTAASTALPAGETALIYASDKTPALVSATVPEEKTVILDLANGGSPLDTIDSSVSGAGAIAVGIKAGNGTEAVFTAAAAAVACFDSETALQNKITEIGVAAGERGVTGVIFDSSSIKEAPGL